MKIALVIKFQRHKISINYKFLRYPKPLLTITRATVFFWNNVTKTILKSNIDILAPILSDLINKSLAMGLFPSLYKELKYFPYLKNKDKLDITNYRTYLSYLSSAKLLLTWSGFEATKTAPWPSRGIHHFGKFLEPSDKWAGRGCYCFLLRWHSWVFLSDQEWAPETSLAQIWNFQL